MLRLPGRGKKSVSKTNFASPYRKLFSKVKDSKKSENSLKRSIILERSKKAFGTIKLVNVEKTFGKKNVLTGVNLEIEHGKIMGIIGVSGSGKTTILRLIIGFYKPSKGVVTFNDKDIRKQKEVVDRNFGFATQDNAFYKNLTAGENLKFFGKLYGLSNEFLDNNIDNVLNLVDLYDEKNVLARNLSGGMQRRLDIACSMIHDPSILILDEPTEDLDPILRAALLRLIKDINKKGTTVIFTTHLLDEAEFLCDEIAILSNGRILEVGGADDLRRSYKAGDEIHLVLESGNYERYKKKIKSAVLEDNKLIVYVPKKEKSSKFLKRILTMVEKNNDKIILADIRKPSLSEVFSSLTKNVKKK